MGTKTFWKRVTVEGDHAYTIRVDIYRSGGSIATAKGDVIILLNGTTVYNATVLDTESSSGSSSRAQATAFYSFNATGATEVRVTGHMVLGDSWEVRVYQDVPPEAQALVTYSVVAIGVTGILTVIALAKYATYWDLSGRSATKETAPTSGSPET